MRKPYVASAPCLRKSSKKKEISRRRGSVSGNARAPRNDEVEAAAREPLRCGFGAVRVGALLGRVRLHLQTERFLAVHRGDAMWENGCLHASLALGEIVSRMTEGEMNTPLAAPQYAQSCSPAQNPQGHQKSARPGLQDHSGTGRSASTPPPARSARVGDPGACATQAHPSEGEGWGTRKTGFVTLAGRSGELEWSGR